MDFTKNLEETMRHFSTTGAFLTAKSPDKVNTMTVSWGFIGQLWGKPHFIVFIRPQRFTDKIIKEADSFTLSIPYGTMKEALVYCGTKSGFDVDKSKVVNFLPAKKVDSCIVEGCQMYYECNRDYSDRFHEAEMNEEILAANYKNDLHYIYFGEIVDCYTD